MTTSTTEPTQTTVDLAFLERYQQAWSDGDEDRIVEMMTPDGVYEASYGPEPFGRRYVGREDIRAGVLRGKGLFPGGHSDHYETHLFGNHGFARWTSSRIGPDGSTIDVQGCDFYEFRDGLVSRKIAFRKSFVADE